MSEVRDSLDRIASPAWKKIALLDIKNRLGIGDIPTEQEKDRIIEEYNKEVYGKV